MTTPIPTDLLSDVVNAADPAAYRATLDRLSGLRSAADPGAGVGFSEQSAQVARSGAATAGGGPIGAVGTPPLATPTHVRVADRSGSAPSAYRKFEGFVLQVLVESMLPREASAFGKGTPGMIWRSMLAEQLGTQLAAAGGIGIAKMLASAHPGEDPSLQAPAIDSAPQGARADNT